ncbi:MAG: hypothetical protein QOJ02_3139 [Acidobacteriota bacterium]|jgi:hypothetical protein|nr:hypothetical protein [Acidobacteriota bacterium]
MTRPARRTERRVARGLSVQDEQQAMEVSFHEETQNSFIRHSPSLSLFYQSSAGTD